MSTTPNAPETTPTPKQKAAQIWQLATDQQAPAAEALRALKERNA